MLYRIRLSITVEFVVRCVPVIHITVGFISLSSDKVEVSIWRSPLYWVHLSIDFLTVLVLLGGPAVGVQSLGCLATGIFVVDLFGVLSIDTLALVAAGSSGYLAAAFSFPSSYLKKSHFYGFVVGFFHV